MKQVYLIIFIFSVIISMGQVPDWAWAHSNSGSGECEARNIAVDPAGNVYITGYFSGSSAVFGATTLTNSGSVGTGEYFIAKFDRTGALQWAKRAQGSDDDEGLSVSFDAAGNVYTTGFFESPTITFGTTVLTNNSTNGLSDVFVVKYNSSGSVLWASAFGGAQEERGNAIRTDASGNVHVLGDFHSLSVQFGSYGVINGGASDIFLARINTGGTVLWARRIGGGQTDNGRDLVLDGSGNIIITGDYNSTTMPTYSPALTNAGGYDFFYARYDASGNILSAASFGGVSDENAFAITINSSGNFFIGGSFGSSSLTLGSLSLGNSGSKDMFFVKFGSTGAVQWANKANGNSASTISDLVTDAAGDLYATGQFNASSVTFSNVSAISNSGGFDAFLVKFNGSTGAGLWAKHPAHSGDDRFTGVGVGGDGYVVISGSYSQTLTLGNNVLSGISGMRALVAKLCFAPASPVSATNATVCAGQSANLTVVLPPGTAASWFNSSAGGSPLSSGTSYAPSAAGVYYVAAKDTNAGCGMYSATRISATLVTHPAVNAGVTISGHTLTAVGQGSVTSWYDCNKKTTIAGQTSGSYVINASGSYAVIMSANGCADTSACDVYSYTPGTPTVIINTGIQENLSGPRMQVYPNPNTGNFTFRASEPGKYKIFNLLGETLLVVEITEENKRGIPLTDFADGMYFISDDQNTSCLRIIVNR